MFRLPPAVYFFHEFERDRWVSEQAKGVPAGSRVLDVGAGPCRYRPLFAHCRYETQDFAQYTGSDQGPFTDRDWWKYGQLDYISDATAIPVADASYDVVLCTEVLEHVPEPIKVVHELARILRPGGRLILTAPLGDGLHMEPYHFYGGYTPYWYHRFLAEAGFDRIAVEPNGGFFKHYGQESQRFSAMLDPRRTREMWWFTFPFWVVTLPWFRLILPAICYLLDRIDRHRGLTVGYHVTAVRQASHG
jgi:SAM-dependent methyltransferase